MRPNEGSNARTALEGRGALSGDQRQKRRMYKACHSYCSVYGVPSFDPEAYVYLCIQGANEDANSRAQNRNERSAVAR